MKAVISNRIYLTVNDRLLNHLKEELTYEVPSHIPGSPIILKNLVTVNNNINGGLKLVSIPSGRTDLIPSNYEIVDKRTYNPVEINLTSSVQPRESQAEFMEFCNDSCILNAKPGWGKTVAAIFAAQKLGQKTLIITHTVALRNQWEKEVVKLTGTKPGIIGSGKYNIEPAIVVANTQSLTKYLQKIKNTFGTVLLDEMHHVTSPTFSKIINTLFARYKIGLTGTLRRKDGKHVVFQDYFGHKKFVPTDENTMKPNIEVYSPPFQIPPASTWAERINLLTKDLHYQAYVMHLADKYVKMGHKVLVVGNRVDFLKTCSSMSFNKAECVTGLDDREAAHEKFANGEVEELWGSISIYSEGISLNPLSALILAVPINNDVLLEQVIARINRKHPGKLWPIAVDIKMQGHTGINQFRTRSQFYRQEGFNVSFCENNS